MSTVKCVGILTSGGDAPGMNAAIRAVTRSAIYNGMRVKGIYRGYKGLILDEIEEFKTQNVSNIIQRGGTILKTARCVEFKTPEGRKQAYDKLQEHGIDALIAIGGDGTLTGARIFAQEFNFPIVGLPGTIDNDLYGTDTTIGYDTALNTIMECVDKIRDTATSHDRLFFVEVMGRDAGFLALNGAIASGAEAAIIHNTALFRIQRLMFQRLTGDDESPFDLIQYFLLFHFSVSPFLFSEFLITQPHPAGCLLFLLLYQSNTAMSTFALCP